MNNSIITTIKRNGIWCTFLGVSMVLSLVLLNTAHVEYAFASTDEEGTTSSQTSTVDIFHGLTDIHEAESEDGEHDGGNGTSISTSDDRHTAGVSGSVYEEVSTKGSEADQKDKTVTEGAEHQQDSDDHDRDDIGTIKDVFHDINTVKPAVSIVATKVVCDQESKLPNWGLGGSDITSHTATDYVASHSGCALAADWKFQWGFSGVKDLSGSFIGEADGSRGIGSNTGTGLSDWKTFGPSGVDGVATTKIYDLQGSPSIWVREVLKDGYIPFTYDSTHPSNENTESAEMYCHTDVLNYDNYDNILDPVLGNTYYCVAFNVAKPVVRVNQPPIITLLGLNPMTILQGAAFADPGATAFDLEDGTITPIATGTVNTLVLGSYTITYTATDSQGATATPKTRTVNVVPVGTPINQKPEITLLGDVVVQLALGTPFTDPSATVSDPEDGNITNKLIATGTVDVNTVGSYTIIYNATDSQNLAADTKTRTVNVVSGMTSCTSNCGGSTTYTYPGCTNPNATNYNRLANKDDGSCSYPGGGGGGGGSTPLTISNEQLAVTGTTSVTVTWNTNLPSDSRVVYGMASVTTLGMKPSYGYQLTTATDSTNVYNHSMVVSGIPSAIATYYRPISSMVSETVTGIELTRTPEISTATPAACEYLKEYMRLGANNNPTEVTKLQLFLKNYDNAADLQVTGFFDVTTDKAVRAFQDRYKKDVLDAWDLPSNTGYVYYTTKKKINEIYCQREFPLTPDQTAEIASFRALIQRVNQVGGSDANVLPLVGVNKTEGSLSGGSVAGASTMKTPITVTVAPSSDKATDFATLNVGAGKDTKRDAEKPENRGRIAIADLLATAPSIAGDVTSPDANPSDVMNENLNNRTMTDDGVVAGTSTKRNLLASVVSSISNRLSHASLKTMYFTLIFLILALVFSVLYLRKNTPAEVSNEAPSPDNE
jgi:hypothetical protein